MSNLNNMEGMSKKKLMPTVRPQMLVEQKQEINQPEIRLQLHNMEPARKMSSSKVVDHPEGDYHKRRRLNRLRFTA
jgi:hypothetical protein